MKSSDLNSSRALLGLLDDYPTRSGYVITPVVLWEEQTNARSSPDEVRAVYRIGLHALCHDDSPRYVDIPESDRPVVQVPLGGDLFMLQPAQFSSNSVGSALKVEQQTSGLMKWNSLYSPEGRALQSPLTVTSLTAPLGAASMSTIAEPVGSSMRERH